MKFVFFLVFCVSIVLGGCSANLNTMLRSNIAEYREFVLYGRKENISANLMCGKRECDYKINGYATDLIEFGVLTISVGDDLVEDKSGEFVLFVGTKKYEGTLEENPFDGTLVADIREIVDKNANVSVTINFQDKSYSLKLKKVDEKWAVSSDDCLKILIANYKKELKSFVNNGGFEGEVYVKIMNDEKDLVQDFYFLISVYGRTGKSINVIISPLNGEILASNTNI